MLRSRFCRTSLPHPGRSRSRSGILPACPSFTTSDGPPPGSAARFPTATGRPGWPRLGWRRQRLTRQVPGLRDAPTAGRPNAQQAQQPTDYANVVSTICLFLVFGGTSYAVATNSIGSAQIRDNSIRSRDVRNNQISSIDVRNGSLVGADFAGGELPAGPRGATGATGSAGPAGATGQAGQDGAQGSPGISGLERVSGASLTDSSSPKTATAPCPAGKRSIGTGSDITGGQSGPFPPTS